MIKKIKNKRNKKENTDTIRNQIQIDIEFNF